jgi:hypothetical protein
LAHATRQRVAIVLSARNIPDKVFQHCEGRAMSACSVTISFDNDRRVACAGGNIAGTVTVLAKEHCRLKEVTLDAGWKTDGKGNRRKGELPRIDLDGERELGAGAEQRYRFSMPVGEGPASYDGTLFRIVWTLKARANVAMGLDAKSEEEFTVTTDASRGDAAFGPAFKRETLDRWHRRSQGGRFLLHMFWVFVLLLPFLLFPAFFIDWDYPGDDELLIGGAVACAGLLFAALLSWREIRNRRRGDVVVRVHPYVLRRGETLLCDISFTPRSDIGVESLGATLLLREYVVYQAGKHTEFKQHAVFEQEQKRDVRAVLSAGNPCDAQLRFTIPADQRATLLVQDNRLEWLLRVRLGFVGASDWKEDFPIAVS